MPFWNTPLAWLIALASSLYAARSLTVPMIRNRSLLQSPSRIHFRPLAKRYGSGSTSTANRIAVMTAEPSYSSKNTLLLPNIVTQSYRGRGVPYRGRGIPHVDTFAEQKMKELWTTDPFDTARSFVSSRIVNKTAEIWFLQRIPLPVNSSRPKTGYEPMFDPLYNKDYEFQFPMQNFEENNPQDKLRSFCLNVTYRGDAFCGWQTQPNNIQQPSIQKTLETYLDPLFETKNRKKGLHKSANLQVAGRTDAGVNAIGQVCRFRTHRTDVTAEDIQRHLDDTCLKEGSAPYLRVTNVLEVPRSFHPTFGASSRVYTYLVDIPSSRQNFWSMKQDLVEKIEYLDELLRELEGQELDYFGLSYGKIQTEDSICTLYHARASLVSRNIGNDKGFSGPCGRQMTATGPGGAKFCCTIGPGLDEEPTVGPPDITTTWIVVCWSTAAIDKAIPI